MATPIAGLTESDKAAILKASQTPGLTNKDVSAFAGLVSAPPTITDQSIAADLYKPITTSTLSQGSPIVIPPPPNKGIPDVASGGAKMDGYSAATSSISSDTSSVPEWMKAYQSMSTLPPSGLEKNQTLYDQSGIAQKIARAEAARAEQLAVEKQYREQQKQLAQYNYNATQLIPAVMQENIAAGGANVTKSGMAPFTAGELRKNAIAASKVQFEAMNTQADLAYAQGQTELADHIVSNAQNHLDKMFEIQMRDAENIYNYQKDFRDKMWNYFTDKEKEQVARADKKDERILAEKKSNIESARTLGMFAVENHRGDIASKIAELDPESPMFSRNLSKYLSQITPYEKSDMGAPTVKTINGVDMMWNPSSQKWENITSITPDGQQSQEAIQKFHTVLNAINSAEQNTKYSGQSPFVKNVVGFFTGPGEYGNLTSDTNTVRTNLMVLMSDPAVRKFFGPQMSNQDSQFMMSIGTTMNPELQSPEKMRDALKEAKDITKRATLYTMGASRVGIIKSGNNETRVGFFLDGTIKDISGNEYDENGNPK